MAPHFSRTRGLFLKSLKPSPVVRGALAELDSDQRNRRNSYGPRKGFGSKRGSVGPQQLSHDSELSRRRAQPDARPSGALEHQ